VDCDPPVTAFVPDQPPEAVQDVAFAALQVKVEALPLATEVGFADRLTVGAAVDPVTDTVADCVALPSGPVQVSTNWVVAESGPLDQTPPVETLPCHPPLAVQAVALVVFQARLAEAPLLTVVGLARNERVGEYREAAVSAALLSAAASEPSAAIPSIEINANANLERWPLRIEPMRVSGIKLIFRGDRFRSSIRKGRHIHSILLICQPVAIFEQHLLATRQAPVHHNELEQSPASSEIACKNRLFFGQ
jgi:hypothetical protein